MHDDIPRRIDVLRNSPAELAIRAAVGAVEEAGAAPQLTQAVMLLQAAREQVADFVDGVENVGAPALYYPSATAAPSNS